MLNVASVSVLSYKISKSDLGWQCKHTRKQYLKQMSSLAYYLYRTQQQNNIHTSNNHNTNDTTNKT